MGAARDHQHCRAGLPDAGKIFCGRCWILFWPKAIPNWELWSGQCQPGGRFHGRDSGRVREPDDRIRYENLPENLGIAENTNAAFAMARGDYIGLLDHDDLLAPDALYEIACRILEERADVIYTDEDKVTAEGGEHYQPHLKPDFNLDLLRSNNYICHFLVVKRDLVRKAGGFRREFDGAQDYDFVFRCVEQAEKISHVPRILYHWRNPQGIHCRQPRQQTVRLRGREAGHRGKSCQNGNSGTVVQTKDFGFYHVNYPVQGEPLVSILIPNKDQKEALENCIRSIVEKSTYKNYEILVIENNSECQETFAYYRRLEKEGVRILRWDNPFNYSAINNFAARQARGEYLLLLNNDTRVITPDWIQGLLGNCQRPEVGITGAKLYYPDNTVQHAGIIIGIGGIAGHAFLNLPRNRSGYLHKASIQMDYSAVTAACMMVKRKVYEELGGFEEKLAVAFNDVDFCLRAGQAGYLVVYNPEVELYHDESKSRGAEDSPKKVRRFQEEIEFMRTRWMDFLKKGDPCYNKNLTLSKWNYSLRAK